MTPSPDPLFRNGLENYRKPAPASVWDRVEAGLERKRRKSVWLKVAAGLFLLIGTSTVFWKREQTDPALATISKESARATLKTDTMIAAATEIQEIGDRNQEIGLAQQSNTIKRIAKLHPEMKVHITVSVNPTTPSGIPIQLQVVSLNESNENITDPLPETQVEKVVEMSGNVSFVESKGTCITYTADQVNSRFIKKEKVLEATPAKKNTSGLQKVIDKALELTNEGTVYGELREKKNEWLSFTMLSNKTEANK